MIARMRSLTSNEHRLTANTVREIADATDAVARRYGYEVQFQNRKLRVGPMVNAIILRWLLMEESERLEFLRAGVAQLEELLEDEGDVIGFMDRVEHRDRTWKPAEDAGPQEKRGRGKKSS